MLPYFDVEQAYAMSGSWPPIAWSGGAHLRQPADTEMLAFLGESARCSQEA